MNLKDRLGNTALHAATERNQIEMAELLIDVGADLDSENRNGMTPLMIAARQGNAVLVKALLAKGANARKTDFTGRDALSWAQESRRPAVVQLLQRAAVRSSRATRDAGCRAAASRRNPRADRASPRPGPGGRQRRGDARTPADKAGRRARPPRGAGGLARDLAGPPPAVAAPSAHRRVRRQSRGRGARRLGLSGRGNGADGAELHRRRRRGEPALPARSTPICASTR